MMDDIIRARVNEILNEKIAMGGAQGIRKLKAPKSKSGMEAYEALRLEGYTEDQIACLARDSKSKSCMGPLSEITVDAHDMAYVDELRKALKESKKRSRARKGKCPKKKKPACPTKRKPACKDACPLKKPKKKVCYSDASAAQEKARKKFAKKAKEAGKLRREGYSQKEAWAMLKK